MGLQGSSDQSNSEKFGVMKFNGLRLNLTPIFDLSRASLSNRVYKFLQGEFPTRCKLSIQKIGRSQMKTIAALSLLLLLSEQTIADYIFFPAKKLPEDPPQETRFCYRFEVSGFDEQIQKLEKKYGNNLLESKIYSHPKGGRALEATVKKDGEITKLIYFTDPLVCEAAQKSMSDPNLTSIPDTTQPEIQETKPTEKSEKALPLTNWWTWDKGACRELAHPSVAIKYFKEIGAPYITNDLEDHGRIIATLITAKVGGKEESVSLFRDKQICEKLKNQASELAAEEQKKTQDKYK